MTIGGNGGCDDLLVVGLLRERGVVRIVVILNVVTLRDSVFLNVGRNILLGLVPIGGINGRDVVLGVVILVGSGVLDGFLLPVIHSGLDFVPGVSLYQHAFVVSAER